MPMKRNFSMETVKFLVNDYLKRAREKIGLNGKALNVKIASFESKKNLN